MSSAISSVSGGSYGLMQQLIADSSATNRKLAQLTTQSATGYVAQTYAGLDTAATGSAADALALAPQIARINTTVANLNTAAGRMGVQQGAITAISQVASRVLSQFQTVNALTPQAVTTVASSARQALSQIAGLLNTQDGGNYVFGGQNSGTAPVPNPNGILGSSFFISIQSAVGSLSGAGAGTTETSVISAATANTPFAASLATSAGLPQVVGANGTLITTGIAANANAFIGPSTGSGTTGSYMLDIMTNLAAIGSLSSGQTADAGFSSFASSTAASLSGAIDTMAQDAGVLGNNQALTATQSTTLQATATALSSQLADADQVDMTSTLSQLSSTQTQLQASYQLIAAMKTMSLTQYI